MVRTVRMIGRAALTGLGSVSVSHHALLPPVITTVVLPDHVNDVQVAPESKLTDADTVMLFGPSFSGVSGAVTGAANVHQFENAHLNSEQG